MTSKRTPQIGDVFTVGTEVVPGVSAICGRVISTGAIVGSIHGCTLVYLYRPGSALARGDMLLPPLLTSRAPWSRGYFVFVRSEPLLPGDFFEKHCFADEGGALYDEESRPVAEAFQPLGRWRLHEDVASIEAAIGAVLKN